MTLICYVEGNSFPNIYGGRTPSSYGQICYCNTMPKAMQLKYPYMVNKFELSNSHGQISVHRTLESAKEAAKHRWQNATFKTPQEYRDER